MQPARLLLIAAMTLVCSSTSVLADTPIAFDPFLMRECPQADGSSLYTNKDLPGCKLMTLKELSSVPSLADMPTYRPTVTAAPHYDIPPHSDRNQSGMVGGGQTVPDWAKDWYASFASSGSVQAELCSLYGEWLHLNMKTRGGFFYGTDPSYGGNLSGNNQRGASYSFYDNARYLTLSRIFGTGFLPTGCP
ncbi:MAG: hypothetical protein EHM80_01710 [Nitrospiraceae bacterium]|nr:MAG: hypothetical protein EHM80_01710 [Nitrospiraceae bacterium]